MSGGGASQNYFESIKALLDKKYEGIEISNRDDLYHIINSEIEKFKLTKDIEGFTKSLEILTLEKTPSGGFKYPVNGSGKVLHEINNSALSLKVEIEASESETPQPRNFEQPSSTTVSSPVHTPPPTPTAEPSKTSNPTAQNNSKKYVYSLIEDLIKLQKETEKIINKRKKEKVRSEDYQIHSVPPKPNYETRDPETLKLFVIMNMMINLSTQDDTSVESYLNTSNDKNPNFAFYKKILSENLAGYKKEDLNKATLNDIDTRLEKLNSSTSPIKEVLQAFNSWWNIRSTRSQRLLAKDAHKFITELEKIAPLKPDAQKQALDKLLINDNVVEFNVKQHLKYISKTPIQPSAQIDIVNQLRLRLTTQEEYANKGTSEQIAINELRTLLQTQNDSTIGMYLIELERNQNPTMSVLGKILQDEFEGIRKKQAKSLTSSLPTAQTIPTKSKVDDTSPKTGSAESGFGPNTPQSSFSPQVQTSTNSLSSQPTPADPGSSPSPQPREQNQPIQAPAQEPLTQLDILKNLIFANLNKYDKENTTIIPRIFKKIEETGAEGNYLGNLIAALNSYANSFLVSESEKRVIRATLNDYQKLANPKASLLQQTTTQTQPRPIDIPVPVPLFSTPIGTTQSPKISQLDSQTLTTHTSSTAKSQQSGQSNPPLTNSYTYARQNQVKNPDVSKALNKIKGELSHLERDGTIQKIDGNDSRGYTFDFNIEESGYVKPNLEGSLEYGASTSNDNVSENSIKVLVNMAASAAPDHSDLRILDSANKSKIESMFKKAFQNYPEKTLIIDGKIVQQGTMPQLSTFKPSQ